MMLLWRRHSNLQAGDWVRPLRSMKIHYDILDLLLSLVVVAVIFGCIFALSGCKTCVPIVEVRDSIRTEYKMDSTYVYVHDSVFRDRYVKGDTIFVNVEKWQIKYRDKIVMQHDTICKTEKEVQEVKVIPSFYKGCTITLWVLIALVVLYVVARILIWIYLKR